MSHGPGFGNFDKPWAHGFSVQSYWWNFSRKKPCQQLCSFSLAPCQRSYACPIAQRLKTIYFPGQSRWWNLCWKNRANRSALLVSLPANKAMHVPWPSFWKLLIFRDNRVDGISPEKPAPTALLFWSRSLPTKLCMSHGPRFGKFEKVWQVLGAQFFRTIVLMKFLLKNPCQQVCSFSLGPCQRSYSCPIAQRLETINFSGQSRWWNLSWKTGASSSALLVSLPANKAMHVPWPKVWKVWESLTSLGCTVFQNNRIDEISPEKPVPTGLLF